jgi:hypothetical protein
MRTPPSVRHLEDFGRTRLSRHFFMRDFLYSDIAMIHNISNLPDDPDLAIEAGKGLCENLLEPLQATFGRIAIRSAYRSPAVNQFGNDRYQSCGSNERNRARHIWDQRDKDGHMGAMATIVVPWLTDRIEEHRSVWSALGANEKDLDERHEWQSMAWWIHDHLPYSELQFFPKLQAFNIGWHEKPKRHISSFAKPRGVLTKSGMENHAGLHKSEYRGFPKFRKA